MKYKLVKEYPGSIKLGTIVYLETEDNYMTNMENDFRLFPKKIVENYPEFWELVVEKDYEILSLRSLDIIEDLENNETINMLLKQGCSIHSVKRLSDGKEEIFTIGDKTNNGTISKFEIDSNGIRVFFEEKPKNYHVSLNTIKHAKTALFRTEDGVDVFNLDKVFYINEWSDDNVLDVLATTASKFTQNKYFSTKEKAEEYILMNKPCLSLNDIFKDVEEMRKGLKTFENSELAKRFKKLVQQKLNK